MFGASPWNSQEPETFATLQRNGFMVIYGDLMAIYRDFTGFSGI